MKEFTGKIKVFFLAAVSLTLICVALFTVSMFTSLDADIGYFESTALLPHVQKAVAIVSVIFFASIVVFIPKKVLPASEPENVVFTTFSALACGFLFVISTIIFYLLYRYDAGWMQPTVRYIYTGIYISGLLAAVYFLLCGLSSSSKWLPLKIASAVFAVANLLLIIVFEHLDYFTPINSVRKTMLFIGFAIAIMFIAQDLRFKANIGQPRAYFFFGASTMLLCSAMSVPHIIAHYAGVLKDSSFLMYYLIALGLALYAFAKLRAYVKYTEYMASIPTEEASPEESATEVDNTEV